MLTPPIASVCTAPGGELLAVRGSCPSNFEEYGGVGANLFDALWCGVQAMGVPCSYVEAHAAMRTLARSGLRHFRVFASLWGSKQVFWLQEPRRFWAAFDRMMDDVRSFGLHVVLSIGAEAWHEVLYRATNGSKAETLNDLVLHTTSESRALARTFTAEVVQRYARRPEVLFWELGNELNLLANMPSGCSDLGGAFGTLNSSEGASGSNLSSIGAVVRPRARTAYAGVASERCFNTSALVDYTHDLASIIRRIDPGRPISSGFAVTRPTAWHQEMCHPGSHARLETSFSSVSGRGMAWSAPAPLDGGAARNASSRRGQGLCAGGTGGIDTLSQWQRMLLWQHEAVDIVSVHAYDGKRGCYFDAYRYKMGCIRQGNVSVLAAAAAAAASAGKLLYVGEYGGPPPNFTGPTVEAQTFPEAVLRWQVAASHAWQERRTDDIPESGKAHETHASKGGGNTAHGMQGPLRRSRILSSIWAWACPSHRSQMQCIYPGPARAALKRAGNMKGVGSSIVASVGNESTAESRSSDRMLALLRWAERRLTCKTGTHCPGAMPSA